MLEPGNESLKDMECLKENLSIFPNMQKNLEFYKESNVSLHWTDCTLTGITGK